MTLLVVSASFFSFQPHAFEYSKSCTASYIKTFEDTKEIKTTGDECMPLIPKPPSFELALAEINLREQISGTNIIQGDMMTHRKAPQSNEIDTLPPTDPASIHETKVPGSQPNKTLTLSSNPLVMDPLSSLKSLYNDAKILCQIQTDNKSQELVSSNILKATSINEDVTNSPFVLAKPTVVNSTNKSNALPTTSNSQKVRFNLNLNDIKYTDECQEIKRARLECVNLSSMPNEYALRKSPSDPSVCFLPSMNVGSSIPFNKTVVLPSIDANPESSILSNEFQKHEIPPRERKVRFQTSLDTKDNGVKSNASFTLPRNHKVLTISKHRAAQESFEKIYSQLDQDYLNIQKQRYLEIFIGTILLLFNCIIISIKKYSK